MMRRKSEIIDTDKNKYVMPSDFWVTANVILGIGTNCRIYSLELQRTVSFDVDAMIG